MAIEILKTPLWILEKTNDNGLKIGMVVFELPEHKTLHFLDSNGHFQGAILNQVIQILLMLRGGAPNEGLINAKMQGKFPEFPVDEDLLLLQFQKHYLNTTQTSCLPLTAAGEEKGADYLDNTVTNKFFKKANFILKYTVNILIEPTNIVFSLNELGDANIDDEAVLKIKERIL